MRNIFPGRSIEEIKKETTVADENRARETRWIIGYKMISDMRIPNLNDYSSTIKMNEEE